MPEKHTILGGKVHVYRRDNSSLWQCSTYLAGKNRRVSTKEDGLAKAKDFAEDWYLGLRGKVRNGEITGGLLYSKSNYLAPSWSGGTGRRTGLKIPRPSLVMRVRPSPPAPFPNQ
jgi:hypothetical protein